ncbi:MAG: beta-N-acetylglucosaminidase, partial [Chitinophagaceae bacterium]
MKNIRISLFLVFSFFLVQCGSAPKTATPKPASQAAQAKFDERELGLTPGNRKDKFPFLKDSEPENHWVDSIYSRMSLTEKTGQLFMVAAYSNKDSVHVNMIDKLIRDYKIGGLIFFQGGPVRQAKLTNRYQSISKIPLFIGIDAEWGLS